MRWEKDGRISYLMHFGHTKQLAELEEWREKAYHSAKIYKDRTKIWHDKRIKPKDFRARDKVLMFNSRVKLFGEGKLHNKWKGPYTIINTSSHGAITLQDDDGKFFKVNGQRLKVFHAPLNSNEEVDVINIIDFNAFHHIHRKKSSSPHSLLSPKPS
jgi:hypothetical protein